ncbi:MAG: bifunctional phosphoglucose/phosphomannose isomerase [Patescibacteria group bacterium]|nr:bifunctional phosphoglucose/phosphomannose isomerase [Patescibacteria group bacterium]
MPSPIDKANMYKVLKDFPLQFGKALTIATKVKVPKKKYSNIIIAGMGGSSLPAAIIETYLADKIKVPILICQNYSLPKEANTKSLVFASSFSGNTEETLSVYKECRRKKIQMIGITTGGELAKLCQKDKLPLILIPNENIQPRCGTGYMFTGILAAMTRAGLAPDKTNEIKATAAALTKMTFEENAKQIAPQLKRKLIVVYASERFKDIARIWKIKFNENSKVLAFYNYFPELNHNETAGLTNFKKENIPTVVIILRNKADHPRILKRMDITSEIIREKGGEVMNIEMPEGNPLTKIFGALYFGDFLSYYLALEYETDPSPVEVVEYLKKRLKE